MFDFQQIDLSLLIASNSLTLAYTFHKNRVTVQARALSDTRASGYIFLDIRFVLDFCYILGLKLRWFPYLIYPKGFDSKKGSPISQYLLFNIKINSRRIYNLLLFIIKLGSYNMILGYNFFDYFRILINIYRRQL
jgi:hypothetical protein